ncbi:NACHT domain-containing protein [Nonomuraea zeae]|uniref:NACHT domain-containing protein n=1 Tax=Nonomuraea zeae TaxID=1642303 RepID=A0A5S4GHM9_9ACTN|nr:NACHT domain-containing protein [Nonomuraea zeae]TMR32463.1 NACHT domain-containing protein [Nonomuraea zeae]
MRRRRFGWQLSVAALAVAVVGALAVAVWRSWTPSADVNLGDAAAVALAGATAIGGVLIWAWRSTAPAAGTATAAGGSAEAAARVLAELVERQWRAEARTRSLDDPAPIPVQWQLTANRSVLNDPRLISAGGERAFTCRSDDIAALAESFRALTRRRLVITGGPGMGKTTLAVQLLLHLLAIRTAGREKEVVPVPVLFPVSVWDVESCPRLQDWLAERLAQDYPALSARELGPGAAAALAHGGHILPVLDGLDEIPAPARARLIQALNASLTDRDQLILTSRSAEFATAVAEAGRPLTSAAVIAPKALLPQAAADYLTACLAASPPPAWQQVLTALRSGSAPGLTRLAATPLGLWLIRTVYLAPGADPSALTGRLGDDAVRLRAHLLDQLIPALIHARPPSTDPADHFRPRHRLDPEATHRYLAYLARAFPPSVTRDIVWWHIARTTPHIRLLTGLITRFTAAQAGALAGGLMIAFTVGPGQGLGYGLVFALVGLLRGGLARDWINDTPGYADLRLRGRVPVLVRAVLGNLAYGLAVGVAGGVVVGLVFGAPFGIIFGLVTGSLVTLASAVIEWAAQPSLTAVSTPRSSWQADDALCRLQSWVGVFAGVLAGLLSGILAGVLAEGFSSEFAGLFTAVLAGTLAGVLTFGNHHASLLCKVAGMRQALAKQLPRRIMDFLDDAHRVGLLRTVGPVYQFRHAALHDHLAAADGSQERPG